MPHTPSTTINLLEVATRAEDARHIIAGFSLAAPALIDQWRQVASALANKTNLPDKIQKANNVIKFGDTSKAYCDFLEKNREEWSFKGGGRAFKDRKILDEAIALGKQFTQSAVDAGFQFAVGESSASPSASASATP